MNPDNETMAAMIDANQVSKRVVNKEEHLDFDGHLNQIVPIDLLIFIEQEVGIPGKTMALWRHRQRIFLLFKVALGRGVFRFSEPKHHAIFQHSDLN